jgi:hypothetical protein
MERIKINNEEVVLKKDFTGWRVVYPLKNQDGSTNWKNVLVGGSYWNLLKIGLIVGIILFVAWSYSRDIEVARKSCEVTWKILI